MRNLSRRVRPVCARTEEEQYALNPVADYQLWVLRTKKWETVASQLIGAVRHKMNAEFSGQHCLTFVSAVGLLACSSVLKRLIKKPQLGCSILFSH